VPVIGGVDFSSPVLVERHLITDNGCYGRRIGLPDDLKDVHTYFAEQNTLRGMGYGEDDVGALAIPLI
jgi:hypothetical protein